MVGEGGAEGVEDEVEPEVELVAEVVAGLEDVFGGELDEVGVVARWGTAPSSVPRPR